MNETIRTLVGGCHCGAVRYEVELDPARGSMCNCSICQKIGGVGAMVKPQAFRLVLGAEVLGEYAWGAKTARRCFCSRCGIQCFGRGHLKELGGDYVSVNLNTVEGLDPRQVQIGHWDGRHDNWLAGTRPERWPLTAAPARP
jgi:hypothetical protein